MTLTPADVVSDYGLHALGRLCRCSSILAALAAAALLLVTIAVLDSRLPRPALAVIVVCSLGGGVGFPLSMIALVLPVGARRIYRRQRSLHSGVGFEWNADRLRITHANGVGDTPWADLHRWREDGRTVLLYHSSALFQMLATRGLTAAQLDEMRRFAAAAGVRGAERPGLRR